jgi:hypothetical protein
VPLSFDLSFVVASYVLDTRAAADEAFSFSHHIAEKRKTGPSRRGHGRIL